ncbi:MAG: adenylate/guanylate cyclase domain-containing protein [Mesorhizobium sp.]
MNCAGCGFEVQSGFAFCPSCGAKQPRACPGCGYACDAGFAFCPRCGTGLGAAAAAPPAAVSAPASPRSIQSDADRRTVTVLFADLSGFTSLSERLDPEVLRGLQNRLFEALTESVEAHGGYVDKFIGDALLALFGAPVAHENDPERALAAALEMIDRAAELGHPAAGQPLSLHIGVNTGPVVTGGFGAGSAKGYSVTGDTVNIAQRLQSMAAPGEVLVGPLTWRLTRNAFGYEPLGELALRGKAGAVTVHRLTGPLEAPRPARGLEAVGVAAPTIGRDGELARLTGALELAQAGTAQLVRVVGEAGIGKSRLVGEFLARIADDPRFATLAVRQAASTPLAAQSYGTLAAVVRSAGGMLQSDPPETVRGKLAALLEELVVPAEDAARLMPLLGHVLGLADPETSLRHVEPEQLKRQILHAIRTIIERRLALSPLLIVVEDLHWADAVSLEALRFVIDRLERTQLMLLVTYRPSLEGDPLDAARIGHTTLRLPPLGRADADALLDAYFGAGWDAQAPQMRERIVAQAGGNPLFAEEIVRGLVEQGRLARTTEGWRASASADAADIPPTLEAMLLARLDRLPPDARRLAQEAAVIGARFESTLLAAAAAEPGRVDAGLELLCDAEIIEEVAGASSVAAQAYRFRQFLVQDVIYNNLLLEKRVDMHGRVGEALEGLVGTEPERLEDLTMLGHHFGRSGQRSKGARYLTRAGDRASVIYANDDAIRLYEQALESLSLAGELPAEQLALAERIADLCGPTGQRATAQSHYETVLAAAQAGNDQVGQARILRKLGRSLWEAGKRDQAEARYVEASALLDVADAPIERAILLQERGRLAFRSGDHEAAARWADEALRHAEAAGPQAEGEAGVEAARAVAEALNTKGVALARLGLSHEAVRQVERSVSVAQAAGIDNAACRGYTNLGVLYCLLDPARAMDVCRRGLDVATRIGDLGFQARLLANFAVASCTFTDRCAGEGVPAAEKAIELDRALDQREHLPVPLIVLGQIHQCSGRPDLAIRLYSEALDVARETNEPQLLFPCYDGLATLNLDLDNLAEAERYFALAQDVCTRHGLEPDSLVVLPFLD